ncbi:MULTISPECIES: AraC family transcriptional regulator [Microbulbifer]|uniref:AraC family transcriptional regulator ligand-binding domain-containing protein n=1 Tax=Microbulbifer celer TaxID=435905 RepID=A0ABW3U8L5_9GAMM|nr:MULTISPECIES: AraC family transcriptional regulator [Microbulbifer]UFN56325.1 AraC family transcriptional regulator [Microbulbifer celer]
MDFDARLIPLHRHPLGFIEAFTSLGADQDALLAGTGISPAMFDLQRAHISYHQWQQLLRNGIRLCRQPNLGLAVGLQLHWSYWGPLGFLVHCSPSLKDAAEAFRRYMVIVQPFYALRAGKSNSYLDTGDRVVEPINYVTPHDHDPMLRAFALQFRLATTLRIWDSCGNKNVSDPEIQVRLADPKPACTRLYEQLPCQSLAFECDSSTISGSMALVFKRFRPLRQRTFDHLIQECERELDHFSESITFCERVRWHIRAHFTPNQELGKVAEQLQLSARSLTRRLSAEGTSFRRLLHEIRMEIAVHHLQHSSLKLDTIADYTGFSCASSLRRAVKNWTGRAAGEVRAATS